MGFPKQEYCSGLPFPSPVLELKLGLRLWTHTQIPGEHTKESPGFAQPGTDSSDKSPLDLCLTSIPRLWKTLIGFYFARGKKIHHNKSYWLITSVLYHRNFGYTFQQ